MESFSPQGHFKRNDMLKDDDFEEVDRSSPDFNLHPCPICSRTFSLSTLEKHASICQKMAMKKRKVFDSSQQRREGTELASLPTPPKTEPARLGSKQSVPSSRRASQSDPSPVQERRRVSIPRDRTPAPPPRQVKRNLAPVTEQCPHCERFFGHKAYDRHVEWCKEKSRIGNPSNNSMVNKAKERLEARTKYRAPPVK